MPEPMRHQRDSDLPIDPDAAGVDDRAGHTATPTPHILAVIALGGVVGTLAQHGLAQALPTAYGHLPWSTFLVNVSGSLLLGLLMVLLEAALAPSRYLRPFLGVGVLGGYTTFSTYTSDVRALLAGGHAPVALAYLFGTVAACLLATLAGIALGRLIETRPA